MSSSPETRTGLAAWQTADLPSPPVLNAWNIFSALGPGVVILGVSIGSGEWLLGPAVFVKYGLTLLWVTLVAIFLQTVLNTELIRYTLYTGEPALTGFMRTWPSSNFWAVLYALFYFVQVGWPGWAGTSAGAIFYLFMGRMAGPGDSETIYWLGTATFLACIMILMVGQRIERTLEILNWILVTFILFGLLVLCLFLLAPTHWAEAALGFFGYDISARQFVFLPTGADWFLLSAFAAYSGAGGMVNLMVSNWARDKGLGMAGITGFIPAAFGGRKVQLAHSGSVFPLTIENLRRWKAWWRIASIDQWAVFFAGGLLGMMLPALLYRAFLPHGADIRSTAIAAELAYAFQTRGEPILAFLLALMGAWVLFKTQLDILEGLVRAVTDILWTGSRRMRLWQRNDVRFVYYGILTVAVIWGLIALRLTEPIILLQLGANMAGIAAALTSLHILYVNTTLLPSALRPPLWRRLTLVSMALFYGFFVYLWLAGGLTPDPTKGFFFNISRYLFGN
ncbi:MAG: hypothetical protein DDG60_08275 [Anaerolineae bacterium]|nr:MAG: hypothetical protein DDG60_08275 [Anaerolineae bacterium]